MLLKKTATGLSVIFLAGLAGAWAQATEEDVEAQAVAAYEQAAANAEEEAATNVEEQAAKPAVAAAPGSGFGEGMPMVGETVTLGGHGRKAKTVMVSAAVFGGERLAALEGRLEATYGVDLDLERVEIEVDYKTGTVVQGAVVEETEQDIILDKNPCKRDLAKLNAPYRKQEIKKIKCGVKELSVVSVVQE